MPRSMNSDLILRLDAIFEKRQYAEVRYGKVAYTWFEWRLRGTPGGDT